MIRIEPRLMKPVCNNLKNVQGGGLKLDRAFLIFMAQSRLERLGPSDVINSNEVHLKKKELESLRKSLSIFGGRCFGLDSHNGQLAAIASLEDWRAFVSKQAFDKTSKILCALSRTKRSDSSEFWYSNQKGDVIIEIDNNLAKTREWKAVKAQSAGLEQKSEPTESRQISPNTFMNMRPNSSDQAYPAQQGNESIGKSISPSQTTTQKIVKNQSSEIETESELLYFEMNQNRDIPNDRFVSKGYVIFNNRFLSEKITFLSKPIRLTTLVTLFVLCIALVALYSEPLTEKNSKTSTPRDETSSSGSAWYHPPSVVELDDS